MVKSQFGNDFISLLHLCSRRIKLWTRRIKLRCDAGVFLLERGAIQVFGFHGLACCQEFGVEAVASITGPPCPDEFAHQGGSAQSGLQGDSASRAIAEEVGLLDPQMTQECDRVLCPLL